MTQSTPTKTYIKVHVPTTLKVKLRQLAEQRGVSISSLLRLIANEYIKNKG
jgi:antitoxin component of RelBE/YafQ-DinJ toxin-antitoxin module